MNSAIRSLDRNRLSVRLVRLVGILVLSVVAFFATRAEAQTPQVNGQALLTWSAPTQATDGTALTGPQALTKYQVFISSSPIADTATPAPTAEPGPAATSYTWLGSVAVGSTLYARVKACNASGCSAYSAQGSKIFNVATPGAPGAPSIVITIQLGP